MLSVRVLKRHWLAFLFPSIETFRKKNFDLPGGRQANGVVKKLERFL
jgi:hypothetical protein